MQNKVISSTTKQKIHSSGAGKTESKHARAERLRAARKESRLKALTEAIGQPGAKLLSVDSSTRGEGWALFIPELRGIPFEHGVMPPGSSEQMILARLKKASGGFPTILVIESQFMAGVQTMIALVKSRARWEVLARLCGYNATFEVLAKEWQSSLRQPGDKGNLERDELKARSLAQANRITGRSIMSDDEADAINLGRWVLNQVQS